MSTKTIKFLFCFVIYVILFIAVSFYPDQTIVAIPIADTLFEYCFNTNIFPLMSFNSFCWKYSVTYLLL